jgi:hypothetical protein
MTDREPTRPLSGRSVWGDYPNSGTGAPHLPTRPIVKGTRWEQALADANEDGLMRLREVVRHYLHRLHKAHPFQDPLNDRLQAPQKADPKST